MNSICICKLIIKEGLIIKSKNKFTIAKKCSSSYIPPVYASNLSVAMTPQLKYSIKHISVHNGVLLIE